MGVQLKDYISSYHCGEISLLVRGSVSVVHMRVLAG